MARKSRKVDYVNVGNKKIWLQKLKTSVKKFHMQPFMQGFLMRVKKTEKEIR